MRPHEMVTCEVFRAKLFAQSCARRHLARIGVHETPVYLRCATCSVGASITTLLVGEGWDPAQGGWRQTMLASHARDCGG